MDPWKIALQYNNHMYYYTIQKTDLYLNNDHEIINNNNGADNNMGFLSLEVFGVAEYISCVYIQGHCISFITNRIDKLFWQPTKDYRWYKKRNFVYFLFFSQPISVPLLQWRTFFYFLLNLGECFARFQFSWVTFASQCCFVVYYNYCNK